MMRAPTGGGAMPLPRLRDRASGLPQRIWQSGAWIIALKQPLAAALVASPLSAAYVRLTEVGAATIHRATTTIWYYLPFGLDPTESEAQTLLDMVGGDIPMDIQERYFVAIAATICFVLISVGFLASD
jgi:hypothetical protein